MGIFIPTLLAALALAGPDATFLADDIAATEGKAILDVFLVIGFAMAILLVDRIGRVRLQLTGFGVMALALRVLAVEEALPGGNGGYLWLVVIGFALFNTFMNAGPNRACAWSRSRSPTRCGSSRRGARSTRSGRSLPAVAARPYPRDSHVSPAPERESESQDGDPLLN